MDICFEAGFSGDLVGDVARDFAGDGVDGLVASLLCVLSGGHGACDTSPGKSSCFSLKSCGTRRAWSTFGAEARRGDFVGEDMTTVWTDQGFNVLYRKISGQV